MTQGPQTNKDSPVRHEDDLPEGEGKGQIFLWVKLILEYTEENFLSLIKGIYIKLASVKTQS